MCKGKRGDSGAEGEKVWLGEQSARGKCGERTTKNEADDRIT